MARKPVQKDFGIGPPSNNSTLPGGQTHATVTRLPGTNTGVVDLAQELGTIGLKASSGYVWEEYMPQLRGRQGMRVYDTMATSDATIGAILTALYAALLNVEWTVTPAEGLAVESPEAVQSTDFAKSLMEDMSFTWHDTISEILSFLTFGWCLMEVVLKRRVGPEQKDAKFRSKYTDGLIGIRKLARRAQDSLQQWSMDAAGGIEGMWQLPIAGGPLVFIPIDRALLFRTRIDKNNPEGFSLLRRAYRAWWVKKTIEDYEAVGIERELAGVPVVSIPNELLVGTDANAINARTTYTKIARDLKFNQQAGLIIPSNMYTDSDGNPTAAPLVKIDLLRGAGARTIDTSAIINRWDQAITRSVLADFLMLGGSSGTKSATGSYSMVLKKTDFFMDSLTHLLNEIESVFNRYLLPRIWSVNGFDPATCPKFKAGDIMPEDIAELGAYVAQLSQAGIMMDDEGTVDYLRDKGGLPPAGGDGQPL